MVLGVGAAVLAVIASFSIKELTLRTHFGAAPGTDAEEGPEPARPTRVPLLD